MPPVYEASLRCQMKTAGGGLWGVSRSGLPDDLVRLEEEGRGDGQAKFPRGLHVDDQLKFHGRLASAPALDLVEQRYVIGDPSGNILVPAQIASPQHEIKGVTYGCELSVWLRICRGLGLQALKDLLDREATADPQVAGGLES